MLVDDVTSQFVYAAGMGQQNWLDGLGEYHCYDWDPTTNPIQPTLRVGRMRYVLRLDQGNVIETWDGAERLSRMEFVAQQKKGQNWGDVNTPSISILTVTETPGLRSVDQFALDWSIETNNVRCVIELRAGGYNSVAFKYSCFAKKSGSYRLDVRTTDFSVVETPLAVAGWDHVGNELGPIELTPAPTSRYRTSRMRWRWRRDERNSHYGVESSGGLRIVALEGDYQQNELRENYPLTYGPQDIQADANDGDEQQMTPSWDTNGHYGTGLYIERANSGTFVNGMGFRFTSVDLGGTPSSIDTGTQLTGYNNGDNNGPQQLTVNWYCEDANQPNAFADSSGNRPADRTGTTTTVSPTPPTNPADNSAFDIDLETVLEEMVETSSYSYSGAAADAINVIADQPDTSNPSRYWGFAHDYDATTENTELTIVYTAVSAGWGPLLGQRRNRLVGT